MLDNALLLRFQHVCSLGSRQQKCEDLACAAFHVAVGHPENVRMRRLGVLVKGGFAGTKPATDVDLPLPAHIALISEDHQSMPAEHFVCDTLCHVADSFVKLQQLWDRCCKQNCLPVEAAAQLRTKQRWKGIYDARDPLHTAHTNCTKNPWRNGKRFSPSSISNHASLHPAAAKHVGNMRLKTHSVTACRMLLIIGADTSCLRSMSCTSAPQTCSTMQMTKSNRVMLG